MTQKTVPRIYFNASADCTALVQAIFGQGSHHPGPAAPLKSIFGSLRLPVFPKAKIAFEKEKICEWDGHTMHKLSQRRLTADWLAPQENDCSQVRSKVSSDWLSSYIKVTGPLLEIFKMDRYFAESPRLWTNI